jgi:methyl-accepting chemotaxis protein
MFARLRITMRIHLLLILAALGFLASSGIGLWSLRSQMLEDRQSQLRNLVDLSLSIARADMTTAGGAASEAGRKAFFSALRATRFGDAKEQNYIFAYDYEGNVLSHVDPKRLGQNRLNVVYANGMKAIQEFIKIAKGPAGLGYIEYPVEKGPGGPLTPKLTLIQNVPEIGGLIGVGVYLDDVNADFWGRVLAESALLVTLLTMIAVAGLLIGRSISRPLTALAHEIARLASGDLAPSSEIVHDEKTEFGEIALSLDVFRANAIKQHELQDAVTEARKRDQERQRHFEEQAQKFQKTITSVVAALTKQVDQLRSSAGALSEAAETATFEAATAAHVSASAADSSNAVAAATEELSCSIREISDQAHRTNAVVEAATHEASRTNKDVSGLASAAEQIGSIVAVIRGIADQTNLLALNATIEAARAGEAGRGFAVVAAEVKELSAQTAKATDAIAEQIQAIQSSTGAAVSAIQSVVGKVAEIQSFTGAIAAAVEEQTAAAQEIASNVAAAAEGSQKAAKSSGEVSQVAGKTKQQAASLSNVSLHLSDATAQLSKAVADFVSALTGSISADEAPASLPGSELFKLAA